MIGDPVLSMFYNRSLGGGQDDPPVGIPAGALGFPPSMKTDVAGKTIVQFSADDPGHPRGMPARDGRHRRAGLWRAPIPTK